MTTGTDIIIILPGPNGAGKSTAGHLLQNHFGCSYLSLEEFFLERYQTYDNYAAHRAEAYQLFEGEVRSCLRSDKKSVVFEEIGLGQESQALIQALQHDFRVKLVCLLASESTCVQRVAARGTQRNFPKTTESVKSVRERFLAESATRYHFDLVIENENISEQDLARRFEELVQLL